jgi:uncharacterized protein
MIDSYPPVAISSTRNFRHWAILFLYLGLFTLAELNSNGSTVRLGLALHAVLLITFLAHGVFSQDRLGRLYTAMAVVPLIRLLSLSMPFWLTDRTNWFALVNVPLIVSTLVAIYTLGYNLRDLGLKFSHIRLQLLVVASGLLIGWLERLIIQPAPMAESLAFSDVLWPVLSLFFFTGLSEELLFRGVLQQTAIEALGKWPGILYIALLFGVMHIGWNSLLDILFVTSVGIYFGWIAYRTKSILGITLAHGLANVVLFIAIPLMR